MRQWALQAAIAPFEVELLSLAQFSGRMMVWRELQAVRGREGGGAPTTFDFLRVLPLPRYCRTKERKKERKKEERTAAFFFCNLIASLRNVNRLPAIPLKTRPRLTPSCSGRRGESKPHASPPYQMEHILRCLCFQMQHICFALLLMAFSSVKITLVNPLENMRRSKRKRRNQNVKTDMQTPVKVGVRDEQDPERTSQGEFAKYLIECRG